MLYLFTILLYVVFLATVCDAKICSWKNLWNEIKMISTQHSSNYGKFKIKIPKEPHSMVIFSRKVRSY